MKIEVKIMIKKIWVLLIGCMCCIGLVSTVSANDSINPYAVGPIRETEQSNTFRAGTGQWFYMKTTCDVYTNKTEIVNYEQFKNITFGYSLENMSHATKYIYNAKHYDLYITSGTLKYAFGGPINGWDLNVQTQHFYQ